MEKWKNAANPELNQAMAEKGRSSATEPHKDRRTRRARSRQSARERAVRDSFE